MLSFRPVRVSRCSKGSRESKTDKVEPIDTEEWSNDDREERKPSTAGGLPCFLRYTYGLMGEVIRSGDMGNRWIEK